jgi:hypothetical protein
VLLVLAGLSVGVARADLATDLLDLPEAGSDAWDEVVRFRLLVEYDRDRSGQIDRNELDAIPCAVWTALDRSIAEDGRYRGLLKTYGFRSDLEWVGFALGFHRRTQTRAEDAMRACGVTDDGPLGEAYVPRPDAAVFGLLESLPYAGAPEWQEMVSSVLSTTFDTDGTRRLDSASEIAAVPCALWASLDAALERDTGHGLVSSYGLRSGLDWRATSLGLDPGSRSAAFLAMQTCGVPGATPVQVRVEPADVTEFVVVVGNLPNGGSAAWDQEVHRRLLASFDADGSGRLDRPEEIATLPCIVWHALDDSVRAGGRYETFVGAYGLARPGTAWLGAEIGFDSEIAEDIRQQVAACGL